MVRFWLKARSKSRGTIIERVAPRYSRKSTTPQWVW